MSSVPPSYPSDPSPPPIQVQNLSEKFAGQVDTFTEEIRSLDYRNASDAAKLETIANTIIQLNNSAEQALKAKL